MGITDELQLAIDAYLGEIKNKKSAALSLKQQNYNRLASQGISAAEATLSQNQRDAYNAYAQYVNPYGIQREAESIYGINNSGLSESNNARAYGTYQNRLSDAQSDYSATVSDINSTLLTNSANLLSEEYGLQAEYLQNLMDSYNENYWKELNYNYKLDRDAIEDERYEREWDYMLAQDAYSGYSQRSSSGRSSSSKNSSDEKYTHTSQSALPSSQTSGVNNDFMSQLVNMTVNSSYSTMMELANKATNGGATAANASTANQILNVGRNANLTKEQLDALSKVLGGIKK